MNCFEARNAFAALWRKTLEPQERGALLSHLKQCPRCDRAFRVFALSAPSLYSDPAPGQDARPGGRQSSRPAGARAENARRALRALCAMVAMIFAAGFAAYLSASVPRQTLDDALGNPEPAGELIGHEELPAALDDFAG